VCARRFHLDILDLEWLACAPAHCGLALDDLSGSFGHGLISVVGDTVGGVKGRRVSPRCGARASPHHVLLDFWNRVPCRSAEKEPRITGPVSPHFIRHRQPATRAAAPRIAPSLPLNVLPERLLQARKSPTYFHTLPFLPRCIISSPPPPLVPKLLFFKSAMHDPKTDRPQRRPAHATSAASRRPSASPPPTRSTSSTRARRTSPMPDSPRSSPIRPPPPPLRPSRP
jgi:hypothetical protein